MLASRSALTAAASGKVHRVRRTIFDADHEAFRRSVREFLDRHARPRVDSFIEARAFPRDLWIEAGKHGFLGLEVPEEYGGSAAGD